MTFIATKARVSNRGVPPDEYLQELVAWARGADAAIFAPNAEPGDVYNRLHPILGPWQSMMHRRAAMCELLRVLAGFESSWRWMEGVDSTNAQSLSHVVGQETGIFQVSEDSEALDGPATDLRDCVIRYCGSNDVQSFIDTMKTDHTFALEYAARLIRFNFRWDGPILRHEIDPWLSRASVEEFVGLLS